MECEECDHHNVENRWRTTATQKALSQIWITSPDPRSSPLHGAKRRRWLSMTTSGTNRNSLSPVSSGTTPTYSHGPHRMCRVFQGSWLSTPWV
jgi:hypothetical protein